MAESFDQEVLGAYRRLAELYPDQQARADVLRVSQPTISRYEAAAAKGNAPRVGLAGLERMRRAIELAEGRRPDLALGIRIALEEVDLLALRLRALLPASAADASEPTPEEAQQAARRYVEGEEDSGNRGAR